VRAVLEPVRGMEGTFGNLTTEQEKALAELASLCCNQQHFFDSGLQLEDLDIWGVSLSAGLETPSKKQSVLLLKFLRARRFVVSDALKMLTDCLKWRKEFGVKNLKNETFPQSLEEGGIVYGKDVHNCPVTYNFYGKMKFSEILAAEDGKGLDTFLRWRVRLQEIAIQRLDFEADIEHVMQIHDYDGASMFDMDSNMKEASSKVISLFQDNYPEMLSTKLFLNVPWFMEMLFSVMAAFSDAKTRKKFSMVGAGNSRVALLEHICPEQLPERSESHVLCRTPAAVS
jgi:hypothetical protein